MNIYKQMQEQAEQIVPGIDLSKLLSACQPNQRIKGLDKIAKLLRSGQFYMTSSWLAAYYAVDKSTLDYIKGSGIT
jgi:hypothetical protein